MEFIVLFVLVNADSVRICLIDFAHSSWHTEIHASELLNEGLDNLVQMIANM